MPGTNRPSGFQKVAGFFDSGWKILIVLIGFGTLISSGAIMVARLKENEVRIDKIETNYKQRVDEMVKDVQHDIDDLTDLVQKQSKEISKLRDQIDNHEISSSEFRGKVKAILKIE